MNLILDQTLISPTLSIHKQCSAFHLVDNLVFELTRTFISNLMDIFRIRFMQSNIGFQENWYYGKICSKKNVASINSIKVRFIGVDGTCRKQCTSMLSSIYPLVHRVRYLEKKTQISYWVRHFTLWKNFVFVWINKSRSLDEWTHRKSPLFEWCAKEWRRRSDQRGSKKEKKFKMISH